jgi:hypothetical protein
MRDLGNPDSPAYFNNILMMMNHKNALDVLRLANGLDLPIPAMLQVLLSGSASSYALQAIGPSITLATCTPWSRSN